MAVEAGIYGVYCKQTGILLYIGESGDVVGRVDSSHHKWKCWIEHCPNGLFDLRVLWTPSKTVTAQERKRKEAELIRQLHPPCNG